MARIVNELRKPFLGWVAANFLGVVALGAIILILPFLKFIPGRLVSTLIIGLPIGFAQWIALRRIAPISILWALTISAGLHVGLMVVNSPMPSGLWKFLDDESLLSMTLATAIIGLLVGCVQWFFLRGHFAKSLIWLLSSAAGLGLGTSLVLASNLINQSGEISIILVVLVYTIATGLAISWMPVFESKADSHLVNGI
jgi:hypothetical protein